MQQKPVLLDEHHATASGQLAEALTWLFVPGNRPERFAKALASGADAVIIDLEDAVDALAKAEARGHVEKFLREATAKVFVRINDAGSGYYTEDVAMLERAAQLAEHGLLGIMLPKAEDRADLEALRSRFDYSVALVAIIESAVGMHRIHEVAAVPGVHRLAFGAVDYAVDLGLGHEPRALDQARSTLVLASKVARLAAPIDAPSLAIKDTGRILAEARWGKDFGFGGKLCIHPAQVAQVEEAYGPSLEQQQWAQRVLSVAEQGAAQIDGQMVDRPVIDQAQDILRRAARRTNRQENP